LAGADERVRGIAIASVEDAESRKRSSAYQVVPQKLVIREPTQRRQTSRQLHGRRMPKAITRDARA
jgi:membrane-bound lytic murein transglycosylase MltF